MKHNGSHANDHGAPGGSSAPLHYVIVGNGAAGASAAETIRAHDAHSRITILTAEPSLMYSRPGLAYVATGEIPPRQVIARRAEWYEQLRLGLVYDAAERLDVVAQRVYLSNGDSLPYDKLLIATGARAAAPPYPDATLKGVVYLDTLEGTKELLRQARRGRKGVVIGGGITALEMVEGFLHRNVETHYFVRGDQLWGRVFNDTESALLEASMKAHGVHIHYRTEAEEILPTRWGHKVRAARLKGGGAFSCQLFGVAIGVTPSLELVRGTPLKLDRGILVNEYLETSVPHVFAAGDCAQVYDPWTRRHMLDVLWPSAVAEGQAAAMNMMGRRQPYEKGTPFNVCKLFGLHVTIIGQINPRSVGDEEPEIVQHLSRGASETWFTRPRTHVSAWAQDGPNTLRLVMDEDKLVGAMLIGEQTLADALRLLIQDEVDIFAIRPALQAGGDEMRRALLRFWHAYQRQVG
ncbi:MAG: FAD-dependent oxidoreductase [Anaerolineales bacterium]|nr:FAD-dependent oxidoreductase [Anaerolineales bacterium]MCB8951448.1 FAD-dependent oxidoreductase [Ardenticatenales bacterium]